MRVVIIDDEAKSREVLKILLVDYKQVEVVGEASDVKSALEVIKSTKPDFIFLDIKLNTEEGFDILDELPDRTFEIIFVTSYDNYALKAIKYAAFDYLLKPIVLDELGKTLEKLGNRIQNKTRKEDNQIMVHTGNLVKKLDPEEIQYVIADGAYSNIFVSGTSYSISKTLKDLETLYLGNKNFIRINRGIVVNGDFIKEYTKGAYFSITMRDNRVFEVSRRKKAEVLEKINLK